jgi:hypothetical protein
MPYSSTSQTLTFWLSEIGDGFAAFEGKPGDHLPIRWGLCMGARR